MDKQSLVTLARTAAESAGLDPALVCAIVEQESNWDTNAIRYEPGFYQRYISAMTGLTDTEKTSRAISWGLMQCMGQTARELGYSGKYFSELCIPEVGLAMGCKIFNSKMKKAQGDMKKALLFWNGGSRPAYVDEVIARMDKYANVAG